MDIDDLRGLMRLSMSHLNFEREAAAAELEQLHLDDRVRPQLLVLRVA